MSPFEVKTDKDTSYGALNSNSITRFNTELYKTPVVADVFTAQFMQDTQVQSVEELFSKYGTGSGLTLATPDSDSNATQPGDRFSVSQFALRGVAAGTAHRDGFDFSPTNINATTLFDVERVDVLHGAQGLLYGATGAGGVVNVVSKQAYFNQQKGSVSTRVDKYGSKSGQVDLNWGNDWAAMRFAGIKQDNNYRRIYIGDNTAGGYGQMAMQLPFGTTNSTLRLSAEETHNDRQVPNNTSVSYTNSTNDPRNGDKLTYLLVTHQLGAINPATGLPFPKGAVDNGHITTQNEQSFAGWRTEEDIDNNIFEASFDTVWTKWLSTSFGALYDKSQEMRGTNVGNLSYPGLNSNPFPNNWAISSTFADSENPNRKKSYRAAALFTFDLFGGKAHSQTAIGFDREYSDSSGGIGYGYYLADSAGNVGVDITKNNLGRTPLPTMWWTVDGGPVQYPFSKVGAKRITYDGRFGGTPGVYVRMPTNPRSSAWVTPNNPLGLASLFPGATGVSGGNSGGWGQQSRNQGYYFANYTSWLNDRLDTLLGFRESDTFTRTANTSTTIQQAFIEKRKSNLPSYDAGIDFQILNLKWLRGYYNYSRTFNVPVNNSNDPLGVAPPNPSGWAHEGGVKFTNASGTISGSLSAYLTQYLNDNYNAGTTFRDVVNPAGLNGSANGPDGGRNQWARLDRKSRGAELILTAAPTPEWRVRFSASIADGTILKDTKYPMLYNDQFYTDGHGNVTYANGQPFLVPTDATTYNKVKTQTTPINPATYPGATFVQLTTAMMNTPGNLYYAWADPNNQPLNGSIGGANGGAGANAALKNALAQFRFGANTGPSALTGATGLPITAMQYDWSDPGNYHGTYVLQRKGNYTVGYPVYATNIETKYTFSHGPLKGFGAGGALLLAWYYRTYYFQAQDQKLHLYSQPMINPQVNLLFSYEHKFRHVTFSTQLNISNVFNRYVISIFPSNGTGYGVPSNVGATYYGEPRNWVWSTKLDF